MGTIVPLYLLYDCVLLQHLLFKLFDMFEKKVSNDTRIKLKTSMITCLTGETRFLLWKSYLYLTKLLSLSAPYLIKLNTKVGNLNHRPLLAHYMRVKFVRIIQ